MGKAGRQAYLGDEEACPVETPGSRGEGPSDTLEDVGLGQTMDKGPITSWDFVL